MNNTTKMSAILFISIIFILTSLWCYSEYLEYQIVEMNTKKEIALAKINAKNRENERNSYTKVIDNIIKVQKAIILDKNIELEIKKQ